MSGALVAPAAAADIVRTVDGPTTRLRLRVSPGAPRSAVVGRHGDAWKVRIAAPPEGGKANDAVVDLLAATFDVPRGAIEILGGLGSRDKTIAVHGLETNEAERRLVAGSTA
jgi:uncharacterized protein